MEKIICAAMHYDNGKQYKQQPLNIQAGIVVCGMRHGNCFVILHELFPAIDCDRVTQGFLTTQNRFVDRKEGAKVFGLDSDFLMSEDLY